MPRHTFAAMFGAVIAQGRDYRETFQEFQPGFDLTEEREKRAAAGQPEWFGEDDLYPDVRPTLAALREAGLWVGIAGTQTVRAGGLLRGLDLPSDMIATSDDWVVSKPDVKFFESVIEATPAEPGEILYVGDRLDNDIRPAVQAGLLTRIRRREERCACGSGPGSCGCVGRGRAQGAGGGVGQCRGQGMQVFLDDGGVTGGQRAAQ